MVVGKVVAGLELAGGDDEGAFAEAAVVVDADDLDAGAAIECTFFRSGGFGVVDVGLERAFVAGLDVGDAFADRDDLQPSSWPGVRG